MRPSSARSPTPRRSQPTRHRARPLFPDAWPRRHFTEIRCGRSSGSRRPLWQRSAFQLLAGAKGAGKGTYLAGLAARISRDENVLFVSTEDSAEIDLKPRLVAAGADIDRCFVIQQHVRLPDDVDELRDLALDSAASGCSSIDPVANHIGDSNSNSDAEVRHAIAPLNALADDLGCLLIGVRHPGKDRSRGALASILGSTAWIDTPRAVVMIAADDEDPHAPPHPGRRRQPIPQRVRAAVPHRGRRRRRARPSRSRSPSTSASPAKNVDDLLAATTNNPSRTQNATELILDILEAEGSQESDTLDARVARETGSARRPSRTHARS